MQTKHLSQSIVISIAFVLAIVSVGSAWYWVSHIERAGAGVVGFSVQEQVRAGKEESVRLLREEYRRTLPQREMLHAHILNADDVPVFLGMVEQLGGESLVHIDAIDPNTAPGELLVALSYTAPLTDVDVLLEKLYQVPYISIIDSVTVTREDADLWTSGIRLRVLMGQHNDK